MKKFYVYAWYNIDTNEIFYIGKGCGNRYKNLNKRNKKFLEYYNSHNTTSKIILNNLLEEEAFQKEQELTDFYRSQNQPLCNLIDGGYGGYSKVWIDEMREYMSEHNPMKNEKQKQRMRDKNPMKNIETAQKVAEKNKRAVIINGQYYNGIVDAAKALNVWENTITNWCKRGYDTNGRPCQYADETQKAYQFKKTCSKEIMIDDKIFPSLKAGCEYLGVKDASPLCKALKAGRSYKGHMCKYVNQQPSQ